MLKEGISKETTEERGLCPFIQDPSEYCYIVKWDSKYTFSAIYYCVNSYEECEIYQNRRNEEYAEK